MKSKYQNQLNWQKSHPEYKIGYCKRNPTFVKIQNRKSTLRKYGLTLESYNQLMKKQKDCCAICGVHQSKCRRPLCVDHNHLSGKVRGLLCDFCNIVIGQTKEDITRIKKIMNYLKKHNLIGKTLPFDYTNWVAYHQTICNAFYV